MEESMKIVLDELVSLKESSYWAGIQNYINLQQDALASFVMSADPNAQQTDIARAQGASMGLTYLVSDIEKHIIRLKEGETGDEPTGKLY